jgi:hypothetical protein
MPVNTPIAEALRTSARAIAMPSNQVPVNLQGQVSILEPTDLYGFTVSRYSAVQLELGNLRSDVDLQLVNNSGDRIQGSYQAGNTAEHIDLDLQPGNYYLYVLPYTGDSVYDLSINVRGYQRFSFDYYFNGQDNTSDYYTGYVYDYIDSYQVGQFYDPNPEQNSTGTNGRYFITGMGDVSNPVQHQQVTIDRYYDTDATGQSFIPTEFSTQTIAGRKALGSEIGHIGNVAFGQDHWEYDGAVSELQATGFSLSDSAPMGDEITLNYAVGNSSNAGTENVNVAFYLSKDEIIDTRDYRLGQNIIAKLFANSAVSQSVRLRLPQAQQAFWDGGGRYYIGMVIDEGNGILEGNEGNNTSAGLGSGAIEIHHALPATLTNPTLAYAKPSLQIEIDALISDTGAYWDTRSNGGIIPYSFYQATSGSYYGNASANELSPEIKTNVRRILDSLETYINLRFVEVADSFLDNNVPAALRYLFSNGEGKDANFYAYAFYPDVDQGSDIHLSNRWERDDKNSFGQGPGNHGYMTILHETLHALGLKHPGDYDVSGGSTEGPYLTPDQDNNSHTIMSYNIAGSEAITPMDYDIRALQYLYGARRYNADATIYQFSSVYNYTGPDPYSSPIKQTLWDSQGIDTLDLSRLDRIDRGYHIDLRSGGMITTQVEFDSQIYYAYQNRQPFFTTSMGTVIAGNTVIENTISSLADDLIIANGAGNVFSGYGLGQGFGNDRIEQSNSSDILDLSSYQLDQVQASLTGEDLLLQFAQGSIRLVKYYATNSRIQIRLAQKNYAYTRGTGWISLA